FSTKLSTGRAQRGCGGAAMPLKRPADAASGRIMASGDPVADAVPVPDAPAGAQTPVYLAVALDVPLPGLFDYSHDRPVPPGVRVRVKFGARAMVGMVWAVRAEPGVAAALVRPIQAALDDLPPMPDDWLRLAEFAAHYYHRPLGEVLLPVLPPSLRRPAAYTGARSAGGPVCRADRRPGAGRKRQGAAMGADAGCAAVAAPVEDAPGADTAAAMAPAQGGPALTEAQAHALAGLQD